MDLVSQFKNTLLSQACKAGNNHMERLEKYCEMAKAFAVVQGGVAVISDLLYDKSHIFSGAFGKALGLDDETECETAFEDMIFSVVDHQDLLDRHILELRYIELIKSLLADERGDYMQSSVIDIRLGDRVVPVIHQTRYLEITDDGSVNIGLCTYLPVGLSFPDKVAGRIFNIKTGMPLSSERLQLVDDNILTRREREVLSLLSKGMASKQIASALNVSLNTVYRHRQNILRHLNVANTAEAVRIGVKMKLVI